MVGDAAHRWRRGAPCSRAWPSRRASPACTWKPACLTRWRDASNCNVLHLVLLLHRLKGQGPQAGETAQVAFDTFLKNLDEGLRDMGVGDLSVGKKMRKLGEAVYGRIKSYDAALAALPDRAELAAVMGRTVYQGAEAPQARRLADYAADVAEGAGRPMPCPTSWRRGSAGPRSRPHDPAPVLRSAPLVRGGAPVPGSARLAHRGACARPGRARRPGGHARPGGAEVPVRRSAPDAPGWTGRNCRAAGAPRSCRPAARRRSPSIPTLAGEFTVRAVPADSAAAVAEDAEVSVDPDADDPPDLIKRRSHRRGRLCGRASGAGDRPVSASSPAQGSSRRPRSIPPRPSRCCRASPRGQWRMRAEKADLAALHRALRTLSSAAAGPSPARIPTSGVRRLQGPRPSLCPTLL